MKKSKVSMLIAGALLSSAVLAGCGSSSSSKSDKADVDSITVWAWDAKYNVKAVELADKIYQKTDDDPVEVKIVESAQDDIVQKLNTALSSGVTKGLPNIVLIEDYRAQSFLAAYPDSFFPLTDIINAKDFVDYKIAAGTFDKEVYNVPFDTASTGMYVRTDILEKAGYKVEDLQDITWDQYIEIAKVVQEKTGVKAITNQMDDLGQIRAMINSSGAWYTGEDGKTPTIKGNAALKEAFEDMKVLYDGGLMNVHNDWAQYVSAFNKGTVWSAPAGNWLTPSITAETSQAGKWAVVPYPRQSVEGSVNASNMGGSSWYVINQNGKEEAAFLKETFGSSTELYKQLTDQIGAIGSYKPATEAGMYDMKVDYFGGQEVYKDFAGWAQEIPAVNYGSNTYEIEDILAKAFTDYTKGGNLDKILSDAQQEAEDQLK
ncbi:ABC transporter substrate-binding protein [Streptococcus sp. 20-1249]|uniref:ABC transporter substrate-binding protein n=1 Tax=Streptococcus hepaticus TaxID=3349163 RepID=UPI00374A4AAD